LDRGDDVYGIDIKPLDKWNPRPGESARSFTRVMKCFDKLDISETGQEVPDTLRRRNFDVCFHLAARARIQPSFREPGAYVKNNVLGTAYILNLFKYTPTNFVYAGSSTADGPATKNPYCATKLAGELLVDTYRESFEMMTAIARFYNVYGEGQANGQDDEGTVIGIFTRQLQSGQNLTVTGDGSQQRDFTAVEDIVSGLYTIGEKGCLTDEQPVYSIGSGRAYSILEVAARFVDEPVETTRFNRIEFIDARRGENQDTLADTRRLEQLGWKATRRLETYIDYVRERTTCPHEA
jgi:UDP-glucose 4-epimerase